MSKALYEKLNVWGQWQLEQGILGDIIEVLVRTEKPLSPQQKDKLQEIGYRTFSVAGNFSSGSVSNIGQLEKVAELPFVRQIELSFPLSKSQQMSFDKLRGGKVDKGKVDK
jgi:hypothetical protein